MTGSGAAIGNWCNKAFNLSVTRNNRLAWVDYLKGMAIILVVYRHVMIGIERSGIPVPAYIRIANEMFYSFRMPLFFLLSGIFINSSLAKRSIRQVLLIKVDNLLYPYLIWVTLQITLQIILARYTNTNRSLIDYTYIFYQPESLDQFWYLPALFNASAFYLLMRSFARPDPRLHLGIALGLYFLAPHLAQISMISDWMRFYIFYALGDILSKYFFEEPVQSFLKKYSTLLAIIPVFALTQVWFLTRQVGIIEFLFIALVGCLFLLALAFRLQTWNSLPFLRVLGYHSLYIYVMHVLVAALIRMILTKIFGIHNYIIPLLAGIAFGATIPVVIYNLFILDGPLWFLFTFRKKKRPPMPPSPAPSFVTLQNRS
jgi:fucose 4-O-acetylase-like acetyltransferase